VRIVLLTQWFAPEPSFKGLPFARALQERGHRVVVITGFPNYPGGRLYPGFRVKPFSRDAIDGVRIVRVPLYPSHDRSRTGRLANYLSFAVSAATIGVALAGSADVAYVYHPPATIALAAWSLRLFRRIPFVYDVQDLWPDTLAATGMVTSPLALRLAGRWCDLAYRTAHTVVVSSPGFKRRLIDRGVRSDRVEVIDNWCEERFITPGPRDEALARRLGLDGRFVVLFAGNMGKAQALEAVLQAAGRLRSSDPRVRFVFVGGGIEVDRLRAYALSLGADNVIFLPQRPPEQIGELLNVADVLLVHLKDDPLFRITIPSKTQAYLAAGRPILMAVEGDAADLVCKASAGVACKPEDPVQIAAAVSDLAARSPAQLEEMGANGRRFYEEHLAMAVGVDQFERVLRNAQHVRRTATT
jgi:colanic acid biosynthesis glycosyl transferase WcaI